MRHLLVALVIGALTVVACSSDDEGADAGPTPAPTVSESVAPSPHPTATGNATAQPEASPTEGTPTATAPRPSVVVEIYNTYYSWGLPTDTNPGKFTPEGDDQSPGMIQLVSVDTGEHRDKGFDRIVFKFRGGWPAADFWFVPEPVEPGSGDPVDLPGKPNGWLFIKMEAATDHDDQGRSVVRHLDSFDTGYSTLVGYAVHGYEGVKAHLGIRVAENSDEERQISAAAMLTHEPDGKYHSLIFDVRHY